MSFRAFLLLTLCACVAPALPAPQGAVPGFRVVGYLPGYRVGGVSADTLRGVTDLVLFSVAPTPAGEIDSSALTPDITRRLQLLRGPAPPRLWVAVGAGICPPASARWRPTPPGGGCSSAR